jgi:L-2,4-diaminobutyrate decarboxylase
MRAGAAPPSPNVSESVARDPAIAEAPEHVPETITRLYEPEALRELGGPVLERLTEFLARSHAGQGSAVAWMPAKDRFAAWVQDIQPRVEDPAGSLGPLLNRVLEESLQAHHPRTAGHALPVSPPIAALAQMAQGLLGNDTSLYELGPAGLAIEHEVVRFCLTQLGWTSGAAGIVTAGGALGNLTALLSARATSMPGYGWREGMNGAPRHAVLASSTALPAIARACAIIGLGEASVMPVAVDASGRMDAGGLPHAFRRAREDGRRVMAIVATSGNETTGTYDPLRAVAEFCKAQRVWFHVDGGHGASALLSGQHRARMDGVELADSVTWDFQKLSFMPTPMAVVAFRDARRSHGFLGADPHAVYFDETDDVHEAGRVTVEGTRGLSTLPMWLTLMTYGTEALVAPLEYTFALAKFLADRLRREPDFEVACEPEANIVCFRFLVPGVTAKATDVLQRRLRRTLLQRGELVLSLADLPEGVFLRATLMNPMLRRSELETLPETLRAAAASIDL